MASKITAELLNALLSADAQRREEAETYFHAIPITERVSGLVHQVEHRQSHLSAVLLRRDILRMTDAQVVMRLIDPLLSSFLASNGANLERIAVGYCLAEICGTMAALSPSSQDKIHVMSRILNAVSDAVTQGDIPSLRLLAAMAERAPAVFNATAISTLENLTKQISSSAFKDSSRHVTLEALMQLLVNAAIATQYDQDGPMLPFSNQPTDTVEPSSAAAALGRSCLPCLIPHLSITMEFSQSSTMVVLQEWAQAASQCPSFLAGDKSVLELVVHISLTLANAHGEDDSTIALAALEVISTLCAVGDVRRKILSQDPALSQRILQGQEHQQGVISLTIHLMITGIDDDTEGWANEPVSLAEGNSWDGDDTAEHAESLLQAFLKTFGQSLSVALPAVETLLQPSLDWRRHCAGLMAMEACLGFAPVSFSPHVPVATAAALNLAGQSQPIRVQWQALRLLGVLCESKTPLDAASSSQVLQILAQAVRSSCSRVSILALLSLVSFCRGGAVASSLSSQDAPHPVVEHLPELLQALTTGPLSSQLTDKGSIVVCIRAIGALACLAETSGEAFAPHYGAVMPGLLRYAQMHHGGNHEISRLVGSAIEAATILGQAIEGDVATRTSYVADAEKIMHLMLPILQAPEVNVDLDPLLSSAARIATVMGDGYVPFIHIVLPHLLKRAATPLDVSVVEGDEAGLDGTRRNKIETDEDLGTESMTVATPGKGIQKFTVNTSQIQEKAQAARAIYEHASALGPDFAPFVDSCMETFGPLISFKFSEEVRSTSAQAVAALFEAACSSADGSAVELNKLQKLEQYFPELVKLLSKQIYEPPTEMEAFYALADALSEVFYSVYRRKETFGRLVASSLSIDDAERTVEMTMHAISSCLKRRSEIYGVLSGQNGILTGVDEEEECNERLSEEEQLMTPLVDSCGYIIKLFKETSIPLFERFVAPILGPCLTNGDVRARHAAICLYDDVVEHCGSEARISTARHAEKLVYGILLGIDPSCNGGDLDVLSASIYGVSQICRYAPASVLEKHMKNILHHLTVMVNSTSKEESDSPMAYENAISALASLVLIGAAPFAGAGYMKPEDVLPLFVRNLPLREDPDEAKICHAGFCDLIEKGSINVKSDTAMVLQVVGEILAYVADGEDIASQETWSRLSSLLHEMQRQLPANQMNAAFAGISMEARNGINLAMQG